MSKIEEGGDLVTSNFKRSKKAPSPVTQSKIIEVDLY